MDVARAEFVPDPDRSRAEMEALQREIAAEAVFEDRVAFDPGRVCARDETLPDADATDTAASASEASADAPLVAGVDQAFLDDRAISAIVVLRAGQVVERVHAVADVEIPYVPGLLSFREGGSILAAFAALSVEPDVALFDGSGRIHYREAGLATHLGVALDLPSVGVAKRLLCGRPADDTEDLPAGARVAIEADDQMTAPAGTVVGYAVQSRQFDGPNRHVNPLYVSPGHRMGAETAADVVLRCAAGYKLPEPTRLADAHADEVRSALD